jgi:uncharacterized surface protein with fasciclin (FAS1) repeats
MSEMKRKALLLVSVFVLLSLTLVTTVSAQTRPSDNIVDIAAKNSNFDTLHAAIVAAGLADTLASADNTFTVFAPTDAAFAALEAANPGILDTVLADPEGLLTTILTYHVVAGEYQSGDVLANATLPSLQGEDLTISLRDGVPYVDNAQITATDILAKNGVIHVIDTVLLPDAITMPAPVVEEAVMDDSAEEVMAEDEVVMEEEEMAEEPMMDDTAGLKTIAEIATEAGTFNQLLSALTATGLADTFAQPGNYTVFAPTDAAFEALGDISLTESQLRSILLYHVVNDSLTRDQIATSTLIPTMSNGRPLFVERDGSQVLNISGAQVVVWNIPASNGIIHVIDSVMIP